MNRILSLLLLAAVSLFISCTQDDEGPSNPFANKQWKFETAEYTDYVEFSEETGNAWEFDKISDCYEGPESFTYSVSGNSLMVTTSIEILNFNWSLNIQETVLTLTDIDDPNEVQIFTLTTFETVNFIPSCD